MPLLDTAGIGHSGTGGDVSLDLGWCLSELAYPSELTWPSWSVALSHPRDDARLEPCGGSASCAERTRSCVSDAVAARNCSIITTVTVTSSSCSRRVK